MRTKPPADPLTGPLPALRYEYVDGYHTVKCECGASCSTTEEVSARDFARRELSKHASRRIVTPQPPADL